MSRLDELEALLRQAESGEGWPAPWASVPDGMDTRRVECRAFDDEDPVVCCGSSEWPMNETDADLIVALRNYAEWLIGLVRDLERVAHNAVGAYIALSDIGADKHLPGYDTCLSDLRATLSRLERGPQ